jgi:serine/threonine-protein kinase
MSLIYHTGGQALWLVPLNPAGTARQIGPSKAHTFNAAISPDGKWIAYQSDESGRFEIYVQPFPDMATRRWQISPNGGAHPLWAHNGRELFFISAAPASMMMSVPVQTGMTFAFDKPSTLFAAGRYWVNVARDYDVSQDDTRFLMVGQPNSGSGPGSQPSFVVVSHWFDVVSARMGHK